MKHVLPLLAVLSAIASASGCGASCGNETVASISSPSGATRAVVFNRNCGATTDVNTQVSVVSSSKALPNSVGNALILDGAVPLKVRWVSESTLLVAGLGSAQVFKQQQSVAGVSIAYDE